MELEKIWQRFNISFILVLPLFKDIISGIKTKDNYKISIQSLFCEYGLINCYLLNDKSRYDKTLKLVFRKDDILVCNLLDKINKPIASLLDLIISSKHFYTIKDLENYIIIYLKIDNKWDRDIKYIRESRYSKISKEFIDYVLYKGEYELSQDQLLNYLYLKNIPAKIAIKHHSLEDIIKSIFNMDKKQELPEVFSSFNKERESLNINNINDTD